jgi:hypothetical protein
MSTSAETASASIAAKWTLHKLRPPSRRKLKLMAGYSVEGTVNRGNVYRLEQDEPAVAPGDGRISGIRLIFPDWKYAAGSQLSKQPSYEVTIDHGNDITTVMHGLESYVVKTGQGVKRGEAIGKLLTGELFFQVKAVGNLLDPVKVSRHFVMQDSAYATGRAGYVREASDLLPYTLSSAVRSFIVKGVRYFVNSVTPKPPLLFNVNFNGSDGTTGVSETPGYDWMTNWRVTAGSILLSGWLGEGQGPDDPLPGNGRYLNMAGRPEDTAHGYGLITTKMAFKFVNNHRYQLKWRAAGNQSTVTASPDVLTIRVGSLVDTTISISDYLQGFVEYSVEFTGNGSSSEMSFQQTDPGGPLRVTGIFLDTIVLTDMSTGTIVFYDNFETDAIPASGGRYSGPAVVGQSSDFWNIYSAFDITSANRECLCGSSSGGGGTSYGCADTVVTGNSQTDYTGFINWNVVDGTLDLIGVGGNWDFQPGHGLYVDMAGTGGNTYGKLESKVSFHFQAFRYYRLKWKMAGNWRSPRTGEIVRYAVGNMVDTTLTIDDYQQPFQDYSVVFAGDATHSKVSFQTISAGGTTGSVYGALLDDVVLEEVTVDGNMDATGVVSTLLSDNFDSENGFTDCVGYGYYGGPGSGAECFAYSSSAYVYLKDSAQNDTLVRLERVTPPVIAKGSAPLWDAMLGTWVQDADSKWTIYGLPPGTYDLYVYGYPSLAGSRYYAQVDDGAIAAAVTADTAVESWAENGNYVVFRGLTLVSGSTVYLEAIGYISGLQVHRA